jgi:hypothetical protein
VGVRETLRLLLWALLPKANRKEVIIMLKFTTMELAELLSACDLAIKRETELAAKYSETMPWKARRYSESTLNLITAREKIYQSLKGK